MIKHAPDLYRVLKDVITSYSIHYTKLYEFNNTFSGNSATYYGGGILLSNTTIQIKNTIIWGNSVDAGGIDPEVHMYNSNPTFSYCDIAGSGGSSAWDTAFGIDGGGNIDADPLFADAENA